MSKNTPSRFSTPKVDPKSDERKSRISQTDVPAYSLTEALRIAKAIAENYGFKPAAPLKVAQATKLSPTSSVFRMLCGASIAYGLTEGGYNAQEIAITELGLRIVKPKTEDDEVRGLREAFLRPNVIKSFLQKYNGASLPRQDIALNVLDDMGVTKDRGSAVLALILSEAEAMGFLREIKGKKYVDLEINDQAVSLSPPDPSLNGHSDEVPDESVMRLPKVNPIAPIADDLIIRKKKVFITHGKNQDFIAPIKKLLSFGELEPVVSVEKHSVSLPVPDKVMNDMRACGGAIIHVEGEQKMLDNTGAEHQVLNPNVLIEIGGAMALYGRRFILLVKDGIKLPSNLQGLFEVRYKNETLDGDTTIRLLEAINDLKRQPLPEETIKS